MAETITSGWGSVGSRDELGRSFLINYFSWRYSLFILFNPFTAAILAAPSLWTRPAIKVPNLKSLSHFPFAWTRERISIKTHSIKNRFVIRPSDILFAGVYVCTFQPGNFTDWAAVKGLILKSFCGSGLPCEYVGPKLWNNHGPLQSSRGRVI